MVLYQCFKCLFFCHYREIIGWDTELSEFMEGQEVITVNLLNTILNNFFPSKVVLGANVMVFSVCRGFIEIVGTRTIDGMLTQLCLVTFNIPSKKKK